MSAYTNQAAVLGEIQEMELIALTDDAPKTGDINQTVLNQVIQNASGYIDRKVANIYGQQLPFNPVPASVVSMALTITCYRLYRRRMVPDEKNKFYSEYKDVCEVLNKVNIGEQHLDDVISRDFPQGAIAGQTTIYGNQPFSNGKLVNTM
jgi:phage gp36-like protein